MTAIHSNAPNFAAAETLSKRDYQAQEGLKVAVSDETWDWVKKESQDQGSFFSKIWDAIKEFFTPSDQVEAKHAFLAFYSEKSTDLEILNGFYKMKELAGFGNHDLCSPEVSYQAKPDGGFFKVYDLKLKIQGVDTPLERQISGDCNEADEIVKVYSSSISSEKDREDFAKCIKVLYQSPRVLAGMVYQSNILQETISLLKDIRKKSPDLKVSFNEAARVLEFRGNRFPEHGSSAVDKSISDLRSGLGVPNVLKKKVESYRPAPFSYDQKNEAIQLIFHAMDTRPKDYTTNDRKQVGKLLEIVYSRGATFEQKETALLNLRNRIGKLPGMAFEASESTVSSFSYEKRSTSGDFEVPKSTDISFIYGVGAFAEITNLRMSFPGNEHSLKPIEIFNVKMRNATSAEIDEKYEAATEEKAGSDPGHPTYVPWTAIFGMGTGIQTPRVLTPKWVIDQESKTIESAETDERQRLNAGNHSAEASVDESGDLLYESSAEDVSDLHEDFYEYDYAISDKLSEDELEDVEIEMPDPKPVPGTWGRQ